MSRMLSQFHSQSRVPKKENYKFGRTLGSGAFGVVREAAGPDGKVAIKIIQKDNKDVKREHVLNELYMLQNLSHRHIIKYIDWFETDQKYYIVTELATGGELFEKMSEKGRFTEIEASRTVNQILQALEFLHGKDIVYRDIKPENILYMSRRKDSDLVLADLGLAKAFMSDNETLQTIAGSLGYAAPEVMRQQGYGKPVDMWALGVLTYQLLCGYPPFKSESFPDLLDEISSSKVVFHERYWKGVSNDAKNFIMALVRVDPKSRLTSCDALAHPWLCGNIGLLP